MKIQLKKYAIEVLTLLSVVYLAISFVVPETQILLWITALFLVINYSVSLTELFRQGKITFSQILINLIQLALFCRLHILIHDVLGAEHYSYALEPRWYDWVELVAVHVLRAVDLLDILNAYGIDLQNIDHQSILAGIVLVSMHIMVDIFILGAIIMVIKRRLANKKPSPRITLLIKLLFFKGKWADDDDVIKIFFAGIMFSILIIAIAAAEEIKQLKHALAFEELVGTNETTIKQLEDDVKQYESLQYNPLSQAFLWLLDNFLRTLDFGDAFQIFDWQLHRVKMGMGLATFAVFTRFFMSFYALRLLNFLYLQLLGGRGKTIDELGKIAISDIYSEEERKIALEALATLGSDAVIPHLAIALADSNEDIRSTAEKALKEVDPQWRENESVYIAIPTLIAELADNSGVQQMNENSRAIRIVLALGNMGKAATKTIPHLLVELVNFEFDRDYDSARDNNFFHTVIDTLEKINPQWQNSEEVQSAISELVAILLADENSWNQRGNAAKILGEIGPAAATAIPHLITAFEKHNYAAVTMALREMGPAAIEAVPTLLTALAKNEHVSRVTSALATIKPLPEQAIPNLVKVLEDSDGSNVRNAIKALGNIELAAIQAILPFIAKALNDKYKNKDYYITEDVRNAAAEVVNKMDEKILENISPAIAQETVPILAEVLLKVYNWNNDIYSVAATKILKKIGKIAIPLLLKILADEDKYIRMSAAEALGKIGPSAEPAIPELLETALVDSESSVRVFAAKALEKIGYATNQVVSHLVTALESNDNSLQTRENAAEALGNIGQIAVPAMPHLVIALKENKPSFLKNFNFSMGSLFSRSSPTALKDSHWWKVREAAAEAIGKIGPTAAQAIPSLIVALEDSKLDVRSASAEALGKIGPTAVQAVPSLIVALENDYSDVQRKAVEALGKIGPDAAQAVPSLMTALGDSDRFVRHEVAKALGKIGPAAAPAVPSLVTTLEDTYKPARLATVITLGKIGPDAALAVPHLITALNNSNHRLDTIEALGNIGSAASPAVPSLVKVGADNMDYWTDKKSKEAFEKALNNIGFAAIPYLATVLVDSDNNVRRLAVLTLKDIGSLAAIPHLVTALADSNEYIRRDAKKALDEIDPTKKLRKPALRKQSFKWYVKYMFWYLKDSID